MSASGVCGGEAISREDKALVGYYIHAALHPMARYIKFRKLGTTIGRSLCRYTIFLLRRVSVSSLQKRLFRNRRDKINFLARLTSFAMRGAVGIAISHHPTSRFSDSSSPTAMAQMGQFRQILGDIKRKLVGRNSSCGPTCHHDPQNCEVTNWQSGKPSSMAPDRDKRPQTSVNISAGLAPGMLFVGYSCRCYMEIWFEWRCTQGKRG